MSATNEELAKEERHLDKKALKPSDFEAQYVHKFYSQKAAAFSKTRRKPWPFINEFFKKYTDDKSLILDSGCGNGRNFLSPNVIGLDYSLSLLECAATLSSLSLVRGDTSCLPFKDNSFDAVLSIAVLHHISTHERRLHALKEVFRVLKCNKHCLLYVWHKNASQQKKFRNIRNDEYFVSWDGSEECLRYYILFDEESLVELCKEAGFVVKNTSVEQESVYALLEKA